MKVLITGGAGFIGSNLVRAALQAGHDVRVLDDLSTGRAQNLEGLDVQVVIGAVQDPDVTSRAVRGMDCVVHLGALGSVPRSVRDPIATHHANATGTLMLLDRARAAGVGHVMCASSSSVYGMNPALPKNEREWVRPMSPYAVSKLATEQYTLAYQQSFGLDTLAFRFFNVYGPGQRADQAYAAVIPTWIDAILRGDPVTVNGDGSNSRDFTFVDTVCAVLLSALENTVTHPEPVNLAFGSNTSLNSLIQELREVVGTHFEVRYDEPRPGDVPHSQADNSTLAKLFPDIQPTHLRSGLDATFDWFTRDGSDSS